ncbi:hypothetical protein Val02_87330 [Virgisporangium aliadipatigenens]|uniref:EcsC family protein n=1 Tax=Virgisporangium aliadipatigenens TaxID=741659 RepID=A0A8J3YWL1_9ACTN|nr:hypothetical protein [Virgisporangium aliadipatigenens]GIJ51847.1 hypothetical protein Val02_87330 [Virgisporangium aliadipatigenens]
MTPPDRDPEVTDAVTELVEEDVEPARRRKLLGRLVRAQAKTRGFVGTLSPRAAVRWMTQAITDVAPHLPIRDLETLRRHHNGKSGDELADRLIRNAARATAGIGATGGGVAAIEWVVTPALLTAPVLLAAETVAVVAIEIKLIGELHEVYGQPVPGKPTERAVALVQAWAQRRGVNPLAPGRGIAAALGTAARKELRERLAKRFGRNLTTLGPLMTGAVVAGVLNRRATLHLAEEVQRDLRKSRRALPPGGRDGGS